MFLIPFILVPTVNVLIGYLAISMEWIPPVAYSVPWTTPGPLIPFLGTGGNLMALVFGFICLAASVIIYAPFVIASNKVAAKMNETKDYTEIV